MKVPKEVNKYCKKCKVHTKHKVTIAKKRTPGSTHPMGAGSKLRIRRRGKNTGTGNLGKLSKGALTKWKRFGKKTSKKTDFRYACSKCKKITTQKKGQRAKKVELQ